MTWSIPSPPAADPTAIDAFRSQVRETSNQFDNELQAKLEYAIGIIEQNAHIQYYQTAAVYRADGFPGQSFDCYPYHIRTNSDARFYLPPSPLVSVESVTYIDNDGANQTLDPAEYEVIIDERPGFIRPAHEKSWPGARSVLVNYTVGFGTVWADIPPNQAEPALQLGERYYRGSIPDQDDLQLLFSTASMGDEFADYL